MRVTITDKEALRALSWKAVASYLDAAGWQRTDDIPGKSVAYQHTDKEGRFWEILVLLRDDLADYVSRMADAVTTLARVEDRSELDVYDDLSTSGGVAARRAHERIRKWLVEEGWRVEDHPDPNVMLKVDVALGNGQSVSLIHEIQYPHHITIAKELVFGEEFQVAFSTLTRDIQRDTFWSIHRDLCIMGVEFDGPGAPPDRMRYYTAVFLDGLNKDTLIQRISLVQRAVALTIWTLDRGFEDGGRSAEATKELLKFVPPGGGPLAVAG